MNQLLSQPAYLKSVWALVAAAAVFWLLMFYPWSQPLGNFWLLMLLATIVLGGAALWLGRAEAAQVYRFEPKHVLIGLGSVAFLYGVFWLGREIASHILPFSGTQIEGIYSTSSQAPPWLIAALLLLWIGPAEEIFWRGFVQHRLMQRYGLWPGYFIATAIYAAIHGWSGNLMLVGAAAVAGAFWGLVFMRYRSVWPGIISHAIWDTLIFVVLPLHG
jgi:membrane protease YdiL (CAAX protease family)